MTSVHDDRLQHQSISLARTLRVSVSVAIALWICPAAPVSAHGDLHDQIAAVTRRIAEQPRSADLYLKRGELYRAHRDWNAALVDYDRALLLNPALDAVFFCRGLLLLETGRPGAARPELDRFLAAHHGHPVARVTRARALVALGEPLAAAFDYSRALALKREPEWFLERAHAFEAAGPAYLKQAVDSLDEGIASLGPLVTLELLAIDLELAQGQYSAALARIDRVRTGMPQQGSWLARRGAVLERAGRTDDARAAYAAALSAIGEMPPTRRATSAVRELEDRVRASLARIADAVDRPVDPRSLRR